MLSVFGLLYTLTIWLEFMAVQMNAHNLSKLSDLQEREPAIPGSFGIYADLNLEGNRLFNNIYAAGSTQYNLFTFGPIYLVDIAWTSIYYYRETLRQHLFNVSLVFLLVSMFLISNYSFIIYFG